MTGKFRTSYSVKLAVSTALLAATGAVHAQTTAPDTTGQTRLADTSSRIPLDEVVVTAQKRSEQLLTVPVPVTALDGADLLDNNQLRVEDWFSLVPGLQVGPALGFGTPQVAIRGIIAGQGANPTVGITIDGVPFGSSTGNGGGYVAPDIDPSDLARVEVLKGPQGTLYGSNSLGGLLQYVTIDPSMSEFSGRVQAGVSEVQNGAEPGYNFRGAVNVPLSDTVAVRASFFTRQDPGYIDDPTHNRTGVNEADTYGGHIATLWRPNDNFSAKFSALFEHTELFGSNFADIAPDLTNLQQSRVPLTGAADTTIQNYSLTLNGKIGNFDLTSISSYGQNKVITSSDESAAFLTPSFAAQDIRTQKWTQELRLSTSIGSHVDWLFGLFYTHESTNAFEGLDFADGTTGALAAVLGDIYVPSTLQEYAAFTDFTFKITDRFDVQVGGRESQNKQTFDTTLVGAGLTGGTAPVIDPQASSKDNAFTYLFTPRYKLMSDGTNSVMVYARVASGFRVGGPNIVAPGIAGVPATFAPDKTQNYDLGLKADLLDRKLFFDASLFYIQWKDLQINEAVAGNTFYANGNHAKSQGAEFQTEWRPLRGLTVDANATWDDAVLTEPLPATATGAFGLDGDRLPFTAKFTGNLQVNEEFPLGAGLRGFVGGEEIYTGERNSLFAASATTLRQVYPAFAQTNLRGGVKWNTWKVNVYATNVTNRRGELGGGIPYSPSTEFLYIVPRTVGIEFSDTF